MSKFYILWKSLSVVKRFLPAFCCCWMFNTAIFYRWNKRFHAGLELLSAWSKLGVMSPKHFLLIFTTKQSKRTYPIRYSPSDRCILSQPSLSTGKKNAFDIRNNICYSTMIWAVERKVVCSKWAKCSSSVSTEDVWYNQFQELSKVIISN